MTRLSFEAKTERETRPVKISFKFSNCVNVTCGTQGTGLEGHDQRAKKVEMKVPKYSPIGPKTRASKIP